MRIGVDKLGEQGRTLGFGLADAWANEAASGALDAPVSTLSGKLSFEHRDTHVAVSVTGAVQATVECVRCGSPTPLAVDVDTELLYVAERTDAKDVELSDTELDYGEYCDGMLDAGAVISEALALALPNRIVCTDVPGCDARTDALLAARGSSGTAGGAFTVLKGLSL